MLEIMKWLGSALLVALVVGVGCKNKETGTSAAVPKPKEAAAGLQQAFTAAEPEVKQQAAVASKALQTADYEKAVETITVIKKQPNITFDQGMAIHESEVALEARLINAAAAGDQNAKRAYERLKASRRN